MNVYDAIADPVRRRIVELVSMRSLPAGRIAEEFDDISRPAVSRHLRLLREAGLVRAESVGRERIYRTEFAALEEIEVWIAALRPDFGQRFDAMETEVHRTRRERERREERTGSDDSAMPDWEANGYQDALGPHYATWARPASGSRPA